MPVSFSDAVMNVMTMLFDCEHKGETRSCSCAFPAQAIKAQEQAFAAFVSMILRLIRTLALLACRCRLRLVES